MKQKEEPAYQKRNIKDSVKKENKFVKFILKHKYYFGLIAVLLIILLWSFIKTALLKSDFNSQKQQIISNYELKLDSLNSDRLLLTAKTFSWALRSELLRENKEQINLFFIEFIKNPEIIKLQLINAKTSVVEISTDKKDEGEIVSGFNLIEDQVIKKDSAAVLIVTPIYGLNKKIGIFVMQFKNLRYE